MTAKKKIFIIPQIVDGGMYDLLPTFYYLKHYHHRKSYFVELHSTDDVVIQPIYKDDNKRFSIQSDNKYPFQDFLHHISRKFPAKDIYISVRGVFTKSMLKMLHEVDSYDLSYRNAFGPLQHELIFKVLLADDRSEVTFPFVEALDKLLPFRSKGTVYIDCPNDDELAIKAIRQVDTLRAELIPKFNELVNMKQEMVYYFNDQFDTLHQQVQYRPIFDKLSKQKALAYLHA